MNLFFRSILLGSAFAAPIIACGFISSGNLKAAMGWCVAGSIEVAIVIILQCVDQAKRR